MKLLLLINLLVLLFQYLQGKRLPVLLKKQTLNHGEVVKNELLTKLSKYHLFTPYQLEQGFRDKASVNLVTEENTLTRVHKTNAFFAIGFDDTEYVLNLTLNHELLAYSYSTLSYSKNGSFVTNKGSKHRNKHHCYYQGNVIGIADSHVVLSTCHGLRGYIMLSDDFVIIEPLQTGNGGRVSGSKHVLYRPNDINKDQYDGSCGNKPYQGNFSAISDDKSSALLRRKRGLTPEYTKYIELMIVADSFEAKKFTKDKLEARIKELVNFVDGFYNKLGIRVVLSHIEIWNDVDRVELSTSPNEVLDAFLTYRVSKLRTESLSSPWVFADNFHFLYGRDFDNSLIGIGSVGSMCTARSGGVSQDTSANVLNTAVIVAHEIGHNFGMSHDSNECSCPDVNGRCIMSSPLSFGPTADWSSCSRAFLEQRSNSGQDNCLLNIPSPDRLYFVGICGNNIVEKGEECDCGNENECQSACCNATTCTLLTGAQCDEGLCCSECQFKQSGTTCREAVSEDCDFTETCPGSSAKCPDDVVVENGSPCDSNTASCVEGICLTYDLQCQVLWGPNARNGHDLCYEIINSGGNSNGNCGYNQENQEFVACTEQHSTCGKLQCAGGSSRPIVDESLAFYSTVFTIPTTGSVNCKAIASDPNPTDAAHQNLVGDGTKCAENKHCVEGECIPMTESRCPSACNEHGRCSNNGICICDEGVTMPYCFGQQVLDESSCGNRIVDIDEECDCGQAGECNSTCCDATTCTLLTGAQCDEGLCCSECQFKQSGTICREAVSEDCDFAEVCSGDSFQCPEDFMLENGSPCNSNTAACVDGTCLTYDMQCQSLWGSDSVDAHELCYFIINEQGDEKGNCGYSQNEEQFISCTEENTKCGKLQCSGGNTHPITHQTRLAYLTTFSSSSSKTISCKTIASERRINDAAYQGLVQDGTMCAENKVCSNGKCVTAPMSRCPSQCNGRGRCSNRDICVCDDGWAMPYCLEEEVVEIKCGNGIIDEDEECDCGEGGSCNSQCCNATTCQLFPEAVCEQGVCCADCQYLNTETVCRTKSNGCDLREYCTGDSVDCPENVYSQDGTLCNNNEAMCFRGICVSLDMQCQEIWGSTARGGSEWCYLIMNSKGKIHGNCGIDGDGNYVPCSSENAMCGTMHCQSGDTVPNNVFPFQTKLYIGGEAIQCKSIGSNHLSVDNKLVGSVKDGTMCGPNKMCLGGICTITPNSACSSQCNGHGVCDNYDNCHCDDGWAPPSCDIAT